MNMNDGAMAEIKGSPQYPGIRGTVVFRAVQGGTEVWVNVAGLPDYRPPARGRKSVGPFGFHIHQGSDCSVGQPNMPFMKAGEHWNPDKQPHGNHAGDFPVLFSNHGVARMTFFTDRFAPMDVVGKTVMIHENPDDYTSQPAGNSGARIACGVIRPMMNPYQKRY